MILGAIVLFGILVTQASWGQAESVRREQSIPILAATTGEHASGAVVYIVVMFEERPDRSGLQLSFHAAPGRFSHVAQKAVHEAVLHTAQALNLSPDSWTVGLIVPYPDVTIGGDSLSGMVALSITALAQGCPVPFQTVLTGTITPEGSIAPVGAVPLKLAAAHAAHIQRVLVSDRQIEGEAHGGLSSPLQISPVRSVREALETILKPPRFQSHAGAVSSDMRPTSGCAMAEVVAQVLHGQARGSASSCGSPITITDFTWRADTGQICERRGAR